MLCGECKSQLTRENIYIANAAAASRTVTYTYDASGNIKSKKQYAYTEATSLSGLTYTETAYGYTADAASSDAWNDRLISVGGNSVTYDAIGNPVTNGTYCRCYVL